jgi:hypothetical protein
LAVCAGHRLLSTTEINDGETTHAKQHGVLAMHATVVRTAMHDGGVHRFAHPDLRRDVARGGGKPDDAAHQESAPA